MIEKMARAAFRDRYPEDVARWEDESPEDQLSYQGNMRAAVEAMMDPSDEVVGAMVVWANLDGNRLAVSKDAKIIWNDLLRAILDEK